MRVTMTSAAARTGRLNEDFTGAVPTAAVLIDGAGPALADDATLLIVDWYGGHRQLRRSSAGADPARASPPLPG
jgi:hypothetical protein